MAGAVASLLAQWGLIPQLGLRPRQLVLWGSLVAAVGRGDDRASPETPTG